MSVSNTEDDLQEHDANNNVTSNNPSDQHDDSPTEVTDNASTIDETEEPLPTSNDILASEDSESKLEQESEQLGAADGIVVESDAASNDDKLDHSPTEVTEIEAKTDEIEEALPTTTDSESRYEPGSEDGIVDASEDSPSLKDQLVVLMTNISLKQETSTNQQFCFNVIKTYQFKFTMIDGSDPSNKTKRDELFDISGLRGKYPQFFIERVASGQIDFWGDYEKFEECCEQGTLGEQLNSIELVQKESDIDIKSKNLLELDEYSKDKSVIILLTTQGMKREIGVNQEKAIFILKSQNIKYTVVDGADPKLKKRRNRLFEISNIKGQYPQFFIVDPKSITDDDDGTRFWGDMEKFEESNENHTLKQDLFMISLPSSPRSKKKGLFSRFKNKKGSINEIGISDTASVDSSDDDMARSVEGSPVSPKKKRGFLPKIFAGGKSEEVVENNHGNVEVADVSLEGPSEAELVGDDDVNGDDDKKEQVELLENKDDTAEVLLEGPSEVEVVCVDDVVDDDDKKDTDHHEESKDLSLETSKEEEMQVAGTEKDSSSADRSPIVERDEKISEIQAVEPVETSNESDVITETEEMKNNEFPSDEQHPPSDIPLSEASKDSNTTEVDETVTKVIATDDGVVESISTANETIIDETNEEIDQAIVPEIMIASDVNDASQDTPSTENDTFSTDKEQVIDEKLNQPEVALDITPSAFNEGSDLTAANEAQAEDIKPDDAEEIDQTIEPENMIASNENDIEQDEVIAESDAFTEKEQMIDDKLNQSDVLLPSSDITPSDFIQGSDSTAANEEEAIDTKPDEDVEEAISGTNENVAENNDEINQATTPEPLIVSDEHNEVSDLLSAENDAFEEKGQMSEEKCDQSDELLQASNITSSELKEGSDLIAINEVQAEEVKPDDGFVEAGPSTNETFADEKNDGIERSDEEHDADNKIDNAGMDETIKNVVLDKVDDSDVDKRDDPLNTSVENNTKATAASDVTEPESMIQASSKCSDAVDTRSDKIDYAIVNEVISSDDNAVSTHEATDVATELNAPEQGSDHNADIVIGSQEFGSVESKKDSNGNATELEPDISSTLENADGFEGESMEIENSLIATQGPTNQSETENEGEHESDAVPSSNESGSPTEEITGSSVSNADEVISSFSKSEGHEAALLAVDNEENKLEGATDENIDNNDTACDTDQETNSSKVSPSPPEDPLPDVDEKEDHAIKNGQTDNATTETSNSEDAGKECNNDGDIPAEKNLESLVVEIAEDSGIVEGADQPCEGESNIEVVLHAEENDSSTPDDNATAIDTQGPTESTLQSSETGVTAASAENDPPSTTADAPNVVDPSENDHVPTSEIVSDDTAFEEKPKLPEDESVSLTELKGTDPVLVESTDPLQSPESRKKLSIPGAFGGMPSSTETQSVHEQESVEVNQKAGVQGGPVKSTKSPIPVAKKLVLPGIFSKPSSSDDTSSKGQESQTSTVAPKRRVGIPSAFGGKAKEETPNAVNQSEGTISQESRIATPKRRVGIPAAFGGKTSSSEDETIKGVSQVEPQKRVYGRVSIPSYSSADVAPLQSANNDGKSDESGLESQRDLQTGPVKPQKEVLKPVKKLNLPGVFGGGSSTSSNTGWRKPSATISVSETPDAAAKEDDAESQKLGGPVRAQKEELKTPKKLIMPGIYSQKK